MMRPHSASAPLVLLGHPILLDNLVPRQVIQLPVTRTSEKVQRAMRAQGSRSTQGQAGGATMNPSLDEYLAAVGRYYGKVTLPYPCTHGENPLCDSRALVPHQSYGSAMQAAARLFLFFLHSIPIQWSWMSSPALTVVERCSHIYWKL